MTTHLQVVVDIEARAKTDNGIITRIAVCPFRFDEGVLSYEELLNRTLYLSIDQQEQIDMGRVTDEMTETLVCVLKSIFLTNMVRGIMPNALTTSTQPITRSTSVNIGSLKNKLMKGAATKSNR